ncbi:MAG: tRNA uridine-5-carboxymethylaminomethyl(34) synthesis GTPase MnmE [Bdellovibrionales bacterium]|nr:tRNA uridine-5-carboxymethylaminomethyl(34) synthesis GTPase MnmE [Bdellovibrionales bacterium]
MNKDPICALCTPPGKGALAVIRLSGRGTRQIARAVAPFLPKKLITQKVYIGEIKDEDQVIDQVVLTYFAEGHSFTGEETVEISCHGGDLIYSEILKLLISVGARPAERGEFSFRAFMNGKMDLVQAEGLHQLIESQNKQAKQTALYQLQGRFSGELDILETKWLDILSRLEADIDFSLEGLGTFSSSEVKKSLIELESQIQNVLSRYRPFESLQKGFTVGLFGPSNVGKSTLFNRLIDEDKSIVTDSAGTTRDVVEGFFSEKRLVLKDTAGFRESEEKAEKIGQKKTKELFSQADFRLLILDGSAPLPSDFKLYGESFQKGWVVWTKKDLCQGLTRKELFSFAQARFPVFFGKASFNDTFFLSSLTGEGVEELRNKLVSLNENSDVLVSNLRHFKNLQVMQESLSKALALLKDSGGERDIISLELREGLLALYEITGKQLDDRILDNIFQQFCIGK